MNTRTLSASPGPSRWNLRALFAALTLLVVSPAQAAVTPWVGFELNNGHIVLSVELNGRPVRAVLDSGAQGNFVSRDFVDEHLEGFHSSGRAKVQGVFGTEEENIYRDIPARIFDTDVVIPDLTTSGLPPDVVVLGQGFFDPYVIQINYPASRIRLVTRDSVDIAEVANVPMDRDRNSGQPLVEVLINGDETAWLTFDTGNAGGLLISRVKAEDMGWLNADEAEEGLAGGVNKVGAVEYFKLDSLSIGPFQLADVEAAVAAEGQGIKVRSEEREAATGTRVRRGKASEGLLGYDILRHFLVTVDFRENLLHLGAPE